MNKSYTAYLLTLFCVLAYIGILTVGPRCTTDRVDLTIDSIEIPLPSSAGCFCGERIKGSENEQASVKVWVVDCVDMGGLIIEESERGTE